MTTAAKYTSLSDKLKALKKRNTLTTSEASRAYQETRRKAAPIVVTGIGPGVLTKIEQSSSSRLDVDPEYQRGETKMVNEIIKALQAGGLVMDPVTLCRRLWGPQDKKLWIIDGHQRVCAFQQLRLPFMAMVHESASLDAEKTFFLACNSRRAVGANIICKSWPGPSGALLREVNESVNHPLYDRICLTSGNNKSRFLPATLVRCMLASSGAMKWTGNIEYLLKRLDHQLSSKPAEDRARALLALIGQLDPTACKALALQCLSRVACERWEREITIPQQKVIDRLRAVVWEREVPAFTLKFQPMLLDAIRKIWK